MGDVGMVERGECLRLTLESRQPLRVTREDVGKDLQRDVATEFRITGTVHLAHSSRPKGSEDFIDAEPSA